MDSINRFRNMISDTLNRKSENNHTKTDKIPRSLQEREMEAAIHIRGIIEIEKTQNINPGSRIPTTPQNNNLTPEIKSDIQTHLEAAIEDRLIQEDLPAQKPDRKPIDSTPTSPKNTHGSTPSNDLILDFPAPHVDDPLVVGSLSISPVPYDHYYNIAKTKPEAIKQQMQYGLSKNEVAAIVAYTGNDYYSDINMQLRNLPDPNLNLGDANAMKKAGIDPHLSDLIANLTNGIKKLPPTQREDEIVKGLGRDVNLPDDEIERYKEGQIVRISMFLSTTTSLEQMVSPEWWRKNPQAIVLHQRANGNGRDVSAFSMFPSEREILFLSNTRFEVTYNGKDQIIGGPVDRGAPPEAYNDPHGRKMLKTIIHLQEIASEPETAVKAQKDPPTATPDKDPSMFKHSIKNF